MRLTPAHLEAATAALRAVLPLEYPADSILRRFFRENSELGVNDRAFIAEAVFGILRHRFFLEQAVGTATPRALLLGYLAKFQGMNLRELTPLVTEAEAKWIAQLKAIKPESQKLAVQAEFPEWLVEKLQVFMDEPGILELGRSMQEPAPLDLRVNTLKGARDEAVALLPDLDVQPSRWAPNGFRLEQKAEAKNPAIHAEPAFIKGLIEIQDEGSQLAALIAGATPGEEVVDLCAGAGGKTLALAAAMENKGQIFATDTDKRRLAPIHARIERAGARNVQVRTPERSGNELADLKGTIDLVVIDAPCTGTGSWRRNPDAKWRLRPGALEIRSKEQVTVLERAVPLVKAGGRIAYITCSVLDEENGAQLRAFVKRHPDFSVEKPASLTAALGERGMLLIGRVAVPFGKCQLARKSGRRVKVNRHFELLTDIP